MTCVWGEPGEPPNRRDENLGGMGARLLAQTPPAVDDGAHSFACRANEVLPLLDAAELGEGEVEVARGGVSKPGVAREIYEELGLGREDALTDMLGEDVFVANRDREPSPFERELARRRSARQTGSDGNELSGIGKDRSDPTRLSDGDEDLLVVASEHDAGVANENRSVVHSVAVFEHGTEQQRYAEYGRAVAAHAIAQEVVACELRKRADVRRPRNDRFGPNHEVDGSGACELGECPLAKLGTGSSRRSADCASK